MAGSTAIEGIPIIRISQHAVDERPRTTVTLKREACGWCPEHLGLIR
jgi:hypothetical protein